MMAEGWSEWLSRPLPGTDAREDADLARALERALAGFDGIESARVVIVRPPSRGTLEEPALRRAAVQVKLSSEVPAVSSWTETVATFVSDAIPNLDSQGLTIVDSAGQILYSAGRAQAPQVRISSVGGTEQRPGGATWAWWGLLLAAAVGLVVTIVLLETQRQRGAQRPVESAGPLGFMESLSDTELRVIFSDERAQVVGAALSNLAPRARERLRRVLRVPPDVQLPPAPPPTEVLTAMAEAFRAKLEAMPGQRG